MMEYILKSNNLPTQVCMSIYIYMKFSVLIFIIPPHVETFVGHKNKFVAKCNITYQINSH
jgi:hypothetical protein